MDVMEADIAGDPMQRRAEGHKRTHPAGRRPENPSLGDAPNRRLRTDAGYRRAKRLSWRPAVGPANIRAPPEWSKVSAKVPSTAPIAALVPMTLSQFRQWRRGPPLGIRWRMRKSQAGPIPNITSGMTVEPIGQAPSRRQGRVFHDGQGRNIAHAAPIKVSRAGVMHSMATPPDRVRRQGQHPEHPAKEIVCPAR